MTKENRRVGRILVMDDDEMVIIIAGHTLKNLGYEVEFARDGHEAVEMYREALQKHTPYSAVILDLAIPGGMGGKETVLQLLELDPHVRAFVSSGYVDDPAMLNYRAHGFCGTIAKPYHYEQIRESLHSAICSTSPAHDTSD